MSSDFCLKAASDSVVKDRPPDQDIANYKGKIEVKKKHKWVHQCMCINVCASVYVHQCMCKLRVRREKRRQTQFKFNVKQNQKLIVNQQKKWIERIRWEDYWKTHLLNQYYKWGRNEWDGGSNNLLLFIIHSDYSTFLQFNLVSIQWFDVKLIPFQLIVRFYFH